MTAQDSKTAARRSRLDAARALVERELLQARSPEGHWTGELSSSALSTATAVCALSIVQRATGRTPFVQEISGGLSWLAQHQNDDGGWGDTTLSLSNLSTTVLCWSAFGAVPGADAKFQTVVLKAQHWIVQHAGSIVPEQLAPAIIARYGKDRTFSVPILTMAALAGRLGHGRDAWRDVIPLPFELAACPPGFFAALRLPVVSYALPALIAIGQARHHHLPSRNPLVRFVRKSTRQYTLKVLQKIQPPNGGFLEATPLTSFVAMSLAGSGHEAHPVCTKGVEFLLRSQRPDGSWPIDTNLATWLTTLSVNALAGANWSAGERQQLAGWLQQQQYQQKHPYTQAAPGGWAWTNLPGGVPDADDTAGALLALCQLGPTEPDFHPAIVAGLRWLMRLQNRDGGIPTFCRGWGALPFDRSSPDLTAHAIRAWQSWLNHLPQPSRPALHRAIARGLRFLRSAQKEDGSWVPLWFGNQHSPTEENPVYGTSRVLCALADVEHAAIAPPMLRKGVEWMIAAQKLDGTWGAFPKGPASIEETALALEALAACANCKSLAALADPLRDSITRGTEWLLQKIESGEWRQPAPLGFYFARLWYYEKLYPLIFAAGALNRIAPLNLATL